MDTNGPRKGKEGFNHEKHETHERDSRGRVRTTNEHEKHVDSVFFWITNAHEWTRKNVDSVFRGSTPVFCDSKTILATANGKPPAKRRTE